MSNPTQTTFTGQQLTGGNGGAGNEALKWLEASSVPSTSTQTLAASEGEAKSEWREKKVTIWHGFQTLDTKDLYLYSEISSVLSTAIQLLEEGVQHLESAVDSFQSQDFITADDQIQHFQRLVPELFCCRTLGDGLGAVVNSLQIAFGNRKGVPLELPQIRAIKRVVERIRKEPFVTFDKAVDLVIVLEDVGLDVTPPAVAHLAELGAEE